MVGSKACLKCHVTKPLSDFQMRKSGKQAGQFASICKSCAVVHTREWRHSNGINKPAMDLVYGALYLGNIAERLFELSFPSLERMPPGYPGYDFICEKGTFDVKGACLLFNRSVIAWKFKINNNEATDNYVLFAFDYRETLNLLHWWVIPSYVISGYSNLTITDSPRVLKKWEKYEKPLIQITKYLDNMKQEESYGIHCKSKEGILS